MFSPIDGEYSARLVPAVAEFAHLSCHSGIATVARQLRLAAGMVTRECVESVLARVRPYMQADGGNIELVAVDRNSAAVRLNGRCAGCPSAHMTLYLGVEMALREQVREFEILRVQ